MKPLVLSLFGCAVLVWAARPALAFKFGYLPGSPEERLHKDWLRDRHHAPSDDLNQPVDQAVRVADAAGPSAVEAG